MTEIVQNPERNYMNALEEYSRTFQRISVCGINQREKWVYFTSRGEKPIPTLASHVHSNYAITEANFRKWCGLPSNELLRENVEHPIDPDYIPVYNGGGPISLVKTLDLIEHQKKIIRQKYSRR